MSEYCPACEQDLAAIEGREVKTHGFPHTCELASRDLRHYVVNDKGERLEKASPELLPETLRKLPSDAVTKDVDDELKVHAEDPPHIHKALMSDYARDEMGDKPIDPFARDSEPIPDDPRLTQIAIDRERIRVMRSWMESQKMRHQAQENSRFNDLPPPTGALGEPMDFGVKHLCFPTNSIHDQVMHAGNHSHCSRLVDGVECRKLKHLRGWQLELDIGSPKLVEKLLARLIDDGFAKADHAKLVKREMNLNTVLNAEGEIWQ